VIPLVMTAGTGLVLYGLSCWLRAVVRGQGRRWLVLFGQAWRAS